MDGAKAGLTAVFLAALLGVVLYADIAAASTAQVHAAPEMTQGSLSTLAAPEDCAPAPQKNTSGISFQTCPPGQVDGPFPLGSTYVAARYPVPAGHRVALPFDVMHGSPLDLYVIDSRDYDAARATNAPGMALWFDWHTWNATKIYLHVPADPLPVASHGGNSSWLTVWDGRGPAPGPHTVARPASPPDRVSAPPPSVIGDAPLPVAEPMPMSRDVAAHADGVVFLWVGDHEQIQAFDWEISFGIEYLRQHPLAVTDVSKEERRGAFLAAEALLGAGTLVFAALAVRPQERAASIPTGPEEGLLDLMQRAGGYLSKLRILLLLAGALLAWAAISILLLAQPFIARGTAVHGDAWTMTSHAAIVTVFVASGILWGTETWRVHRELVRWQGIQRSIAVG